MAGKGDKYRKVDKKKFDLNYDQIFVKCPKCKGKNLYNLHTDNGFMMCSCGTSISDNQNYVVTTYYLKADEVPDLCNDAKTFAELVAKLLNNYYNGK